MSSTYDKNLMFEPTGMQIVGGLIYICDTGNRRILRFNPTNMTMLDAYDLPGMDAGERPFAICVQSSRCYVLSSYPSGPTSARIDLVIYALSSPTTAAITFLRRVTLSAAGIYGGPNPPQIGGIFLQYAGGFIVAGCFVVTAINPTVMNNKIIKIDLDGNIISTTTLPAGDPLYGMAVG